MKKVSEEKKRLLNTGVVEATNLMEMLSVDHKVLLANILPEFNFPILPEKIGITKRFKIISQSLNNQFGFRFFDKYKDHNSDTIRTFACYLLGEQDFLFTKKLDLIRPLADDSNSGVREWAWIAIRTDFAKNLNLSLKTLLPWTEHSSANIRRFSSELSRPRGVWCEHIKELKSNPKLGLSILTALNSDPAKYVQIIRW